jgi:hypothetical protein
MNFHTVNMQHSISQSIVTDYRLNANHNSRVHLKRRRGIVTDYRLVGYNGMNMKNDDPLVVICI